MAQAPTDLQVFLLVGYKKSTSFYPSRVRIGERNIKVLTSDVTALTRVFQDKFHISNEVKLVPADAARNAGTRRHELTIRITNEFPVVNQTFRTMGFRYAIKERFWYKDSLNEPLSVRGLRYVCELIHPFTGETVYASSEDQLMDSAFKTSFCLSTFSVIIDMLKAQQIPFTCESCIESE